MVARSRAFGDGEVARGGGEVASIILAVPRGVDFIFSVP